ncbi:unnamed protein product [Brassica oleracea]
MAPTIRTLAKYKSDQYYYSVDFFGEDLTVTLTKTPSDIRRWIRDVVFSHRRSRSCHPLIVGVGVNWAPHCVSPTSFQGSSRIQTQLFQDAKRLARTRYQLEIGELLDARMYVVDSQGTSLRGRSFEEIVEKCMGFRGVKLDRGISRSDWSVEYLGNDQILQVVENKNCYSLADFFYNKIRWDNGKHES